MHEVEPRYIPAMPTCNCTTRTCDRDHRWDDEIEPIGPNRKQRRKAHREAMKLIKRSKKRSSTHNRQDAIDGAKS